MTSRHLARVVAAEPDAVYAVARDPEQLPRWAAGLATGAAATEGEDLVVESPMGCVRVRFAARNPYGVLDHAVTLPSGDTVTNPLRVLPHPDGSEVVFTIRQGAASDADFARDCAQVEADLARLAELVESAQGDHAGRVS